VAGVKRRKRSAEEKAKVALEAIRGHRTVPEIAVEYGVHPSQILKWKKEALQRLPDVFQAPSEHRGEGRDFLISTLYEEIGKLKVELDWLKKKSDGLG
jgi:transposase-like protein